ncbi:MAG: class I SAM-dependent methyltransferase [Candidatus Adiutrix sp.]
MSFNPNHLLNNSIAMINPMVMQAKDEKLAAPVPPPPFDPEMYTNAFGRLGMLSIENVVDLGCGAGNFASVMVSRKQRPEVYLGIDSNHAQISIAKAAYPGWKFVYGDFTHERIRAEYEWYGAFLMLNLLDTFSDDGDIELLKSMPDGKPLVFSMPKAPREGSHLYLPDGKDIYDRYSSILAIRTVGRFRSHANEHFSMVIASRW